MYAPSESDLYAVVYGHCHAGPIVSFWSTADSVISLMTIYVNLNGRGKGYSVWKRKSPTTPWQLITTT